MTAAEVDEFLREVGQRSAEVFTETFPALQQRLLRFDPFQLLAMFSFYDLTSMSTSQSEWERKDLILQHHVELIQALCLRSTPDAFIMFPVTPAEFTILRENVRDATLSFSTRRHSELSTKLSPAERQRKSIVERMRLDTQALRNWGWEEQVLSVLTAVLEPLNDAFEQALGVRATDLIQMWGNISTIIEERINNHMQYLATFWPARGLQELVANYYQPYADAEEAEKELLAFAAEQELSADQLRVMLLAHSDLRLPGIYKHTLQDFVDAYPRDIDADTLQSVLNRWSIQFGELAAERADFFFLDNPIWSRPLILTADDTYFLPLPGALVSFGFRMFEHLMQSHPALLDRYHKQRGDALEDELARLLQTAFPRATILRGSLWTPEGTSDVYENDLLLQLDSLVLIVEAKAGGIHETARRGAEKRLERVIDDLIVAPARQSQRFAEYLAAHPGPHTFPTRSGTTNHIDTSDTRTISRLSVILEPIGDLHTYWPALREAGLIDATLQIPPTYLLTDLESVLTYLDDDPQRLHYLVRRSEIEQHVEYAADETDLLALYVKTGFVLGEAEFSDPV